jgi:endonuclease IV
MKQFLLFAGTEAAKASGMNGFVADFDSAAEAFLSLVDQQTASEWWHILDTQTGEVVERRHIRTSNGMIGFQRSERVVGTQAKKTLPISTPTPKAGDLNELEAGLRTVVTNGLRSGNGHANGHANGADA